MTPEYLLTIAASFDDPGQAESAIDELWHAGFAHERVGIAVPGSHVVEATTRTGPIEESGGHGAVVGSVTGATVGTIAGALVATLVPGIGTVLTGGLLAGIAASAAAGAAAGAYLGPFVALELSEKDARFVGRELRGGRSIVVVKPESEERADKARAILLEHGGKDAAIL